MRRWIRSVTSCVISVANFLIVQPPFVVPSPHPQTSVNWSFHVKTMEWKGDLWMINWEHIWARHGPSVVPTKPRQGIFYESQFRRFTLHELISETCRDPTHQTREAKTGRFIRYRHWASDAVGWDALGDCAWLGVVVVVGNDGRGAAITAFPCHAPV